MHVVILGASKGCAHYAALDILDNKENTITVLLRKPDAVKGTKLEPYITEGRCKVVQGDATNEEDLKKLFEDKVDVFVSGIGGAPHLSAHVSLELDSPLCTISGLALLKVMAGLPEPRPRLVVISSMGIGGTHDTMPLLHRIAYPRILRGPHEDKEGLELILKKAAMHFATPPLDQAQVPDILTPDVYASVPEDVLDQLVIVRPAWLTNGEYSGKSRAGEGITVAAVSRGDVGRFIADDCVSKDTWVNKEPTLGHDAFK